MRNLFHIFRAPALLSLLLTSSAFMSCSSNPNTPWSRESRPQTVDIDHTPVKWQSIGNCWAYSHLGWIESLIKKGTGESYNFSETYLTYRHFEEQLLLNRPLEEIQTGGSFYRTRYLLQKYGLLLEGQFIPEEAEQSKSYIQAQAVSRINQSLQNGLLKTDRSPRSIRRELNMAFGLSEDDFATRTQFIRFPKDILTQVSNDSQITLENHLVSWMEVRWDPDLGHIPADLPAEASVLSRSRKNLLTRVKKALNKGYPVIMNWFVDFNALNQDGIFNLETLRQNGIGSQGLHSTVMEDYVVKGSHPENGVDFQTPEGETSPTIKEWAAEFGLLQYVVIKNSWGGAERLDRPSYSRFGEKGYARLESSYLFAWLPDSEQSGSPQTAITSFILPTIP